ncbi:MAG: glucokinase [Gammaproteobacteria bacterium]
MHLIAGDIGGTKSELAWVEDGQPDGAQQRCERVYPSADFASIEALLRQFMRDAGPAARPERFLLAVPGPVDGQRARLTNLDWTLDAEALGRDLGGAAVRLVNDFEAASAGVTGLGPDDVLALNPQPAEARGVRAITGAGTGLGLAFALDDTSGRAHICPSEGGHVDFAPADARQVRLLDALRARHGHVSWERVASGSAFDDLYRFCCAEAGKRLPDAPVDGAALSERAGAGDVVANAALDLFVELYGAWVGNVALLFQPRGGLYVAGGVSRQLRGRLQTPRFLAAATDKGRMRGVVERTPIFLVTTERLGVRGAIALGRSMASESDTA